MKGESGEGRQAWGRSGRGETGARTSDVFLLAVWPALGKCSARNIPFNIHKTLTLSQTHIQKGRGRETKRETESKITLLLMFILLVRPVLPPQCR